jgi:hypothetical protein
MMAPLLPKESNVPHIRRFPRLTATAAILAACLVPAAGTSAASADSQPFQPYTILGTRYGCPVPGTGTVRPCFIAPWTTYEKQGLS